MSEARIIGAKQSIVAHGFYPSTWETEVGEFVSSRSAWSVKLVLGQLGLPRETLSLIIIIILKLHSKVFLELGNTSPTIQLRQ